MARVKGAMMTRKRRNATLKLSRIVAMSFCEPRSCKSCLSS